MITVIGLGEELGDLSAAASKELRGGGRLTLRTRDCPAAAWLGENGVAFDTLDALYEKSDDFDELARNTANCLLRKAREGDMMYAVPGGGGLEDATVTAFLAAARLAGIPSRLIPGVSPRERLAFAAGGFMHARSLPAQYVAGIGEAEPEALWGGERNGGSGETGEAATSAAFGAVANLAQTAVSEDNAAPSESEAESESVAFGTSGGAFGSAVSGASSAAPSPGENRPDSSLINTNFADAFGLGVGNGLPAALDRREPLLIGEMDNPLLAAEVKLRLLAVYPDDHRAAFRPQTGDVLWIPLYELDRQPAESYGHLAGVAVPPLRLRDARRYGFSDLLDIMAILRAPNGCPWDREQTHASIAMAAVEEAYEVLEAIESGEPMRIADELGDLLLQAVFQAQIGADHGEFDITDVTTAICHKMISRHRHIFGGAQAGTADDVLAIWDAVKRTEKGHEAQSDVLSDVPRCFPALLRAQKLQKKAWRDPDVWPEPILSPKTPFESVGLALFELARNARLQGVSPEEALTWANDAFIQRYRIAEQHFADGETLYGASATAVGEIWRKGG